MVPSLHVMGWVFRRTVYGRKPQLADDLKLRFGYGLTGKPKYRAPTNFAMLFGNTQATPNTI